MGWVVALLVFVVMGVALLNKSASKRFGLKEFRRVALAARRAVSGLVDGGVVKLNSDQELAAERAVVWAQVGTIEGLGYTNAVKDDADAERQGNESVRKEATANIESHREEILDLESMISDEQVTIADANSRDRSLDADLALLG